MTLKKTTIGLTLVLLTILFFPRSTFVTAQQATPITNCMTFWNPGNYVLTTNLNVNIGGLPFEGACFRFNTNNVTIDGQGHSITLTSGDRLVGITNSEAVDHITIKNLTSNGGMLVRGSNASFFTIEDATLGGLTFEGTDDITIHDSTISGGISTAAFGTDNVYRVNVERNTVQSTGYTNGYFKSGDEHPCPRGDFIIRDNTFTNNSTLTGSVISSLRINCATHSVVTGNTIRGMGTSMGYYMRDESDDGYYENNIFWVEKNEAIRMASGNTDPPNPKSFPSRNVFFKNTFRSDDSDNIQLGYLYLQGMGSGNRFEYNTFVGTRGGTVQLGGSYGGNTFDHNTFYITGTGNQLVDFSYNQSNPDIWTNNIFSYPNGTIFSYDAFAFSRYTGNYNLFQNRSGSVNFGGYGGSLAAWRTNSGNQDDMNSIEANPLFNNPGNFDFTLQASSPARGAGSGGTDIGAKPYGSEPPPICAENWSCTEFSTCTNSVQSRTCIDANNCGTTNTRPPLTQSCVMPDTTAPALVNTLQAS